MSVVVKCHCGWEGALQGTSAYEPLRCGGCNTVLFVPVSTPAGAATLPEGGQRQPLHPTVILPPAASPNAPTPRHTLVQEYLGLVRAVAVWIGHFLLPIGAYLVAAFKFYWEHRRAIRAGGWLWLTGKLPALERPDDIRRELRLLLIEQSGMHPVEGVWHVELPERCVACGVETPGVWQYEPRSAIDPYPLWLGPVGGVLAGLLLGWWYSSLLWIIVSPAVGVVVGYALRRSELFVLRLRRCPRHADARTLPGLSLFHGELILRVGHRDVKLAFLHREHAFRDPDESAPRPWSEPPQRPQLAESVAESAAIIPEGEAHRFAAAEDGESASMSASTPLGLAPAHVIPGPAAADSGAGLETDDGYRVQTPSISRPA